MFESFARIHASGTVTTSEKTKKQDEHRGKTLLANIAVGITLVGFITQYFGLRATHSSVIVLQLVAIVAMTALRSYPHSDRVGRNDMEDSDAVSEYELDWLAKRLGGCTSWEVSHIPSQPSGDDVIPAGPAVGENTPADTSPVNVTAPSTDLIENAVESEKMQSTAGNPSPVPQGGMGQDSSGPRPVHEIVENSNGKPPATPQVEPIPQEESIAQIVMRIRGSLAELSNDWILSSRKTVAALQEAIEGTLNDVFAKMDIKDEYRNELLFEWRVPVTAKHGIPEAFHEHEVSLKLTRQRDETDSLGD